jgi:hypothetical protein
MDQTILDLSEVKNPKVGEEVTIYDNRRESPNSVESIAEMLSTIPYVVTTSLGRRVKRIGIENYKLDPQTDPDDADKNRINPKNPNLNAPAT